MAAAGRKEYPISMRLPETDVAMIDRAASLRGRSRTDFVRDAAVRAAEEVVMENRLIRMSPEGFAEFMEVLSAPAAPVSESSRLLLAARARAARAVGGRLRRQAVRCASFAARTAQRGARRFAVFLRQAHAG